MARHNVREQLLDAGLKTLLEQGFNGCGVQDITEAAGVPKGSFYNHFESKEALGAEIVERYGARSERRAEVRDLSMPGLERLKRHFRSLNDSLVARNFSRGCLLGNFSAEMADKSPMIREKLAVLFAEWTKDLEIAIRDAQSDGSIKTTLDPAVLAGFLLDSFEGALLRARVDRNSDALERFMTLAFTQILI